MSLAAWTVVPMVNNLKMTLDAVGDVGRQKGVGESWSLVIGNGIAAEDRERIEKVVDEAGEVGKFLCAWYHNPPLPSLAATWNRGLEFCWRQGAEDALVINNDVRLTADTYETLRLIMKEEKALLVTATGVEEEETLFKEAAELGQRKMALGEGGMWRRGGPGFSCFLISRECHEKYQFDEMLTPAFCEDSDYHRQLMLAGEGERIFGTNVRYLHLGGQTLKSMSPEKRQATEEAISRGARAHYQRKWGGGVNEETWIVPFFSTTEETGGVKPIAPGTPEWIVEKWLLGNMGKGVANPELFDEIRSRW